MIIGCVVGSLGQIVAAQMPALRETPRAEVAERGAAELARIEAVSAALRAADLAQAQALLAAAMDDGLTTDEEWATAWASVAAGWHRRLAALRPGERYARLHAWTMPIDGRTSLRAWTVLTPFEAPPDIFARALGERPRRDSFPIPRLGDSEGLFSTAWELVTAADESNNLRTLAAQVSELAEQTVPHAPLLLTLIRIREGTRPNEALRQELEIWASKQPQMPAASMPDTLVIASACLTRDWLQPLGEQLLHLLHERTLGQPGLFSSYVRCAQARAIWRRHTGLSADRASLTNLNLWIPARGHEPAPYAYGGVRPIWLGHQSHIMHVGGLGNDYLLFTYPLTGDFAFRGEAQECGPFDADAGLAFGGLGYGVSGTARTLQIGDPGHPSARLLTCPFAKLGDAARYQRWSFQTRADEVAVALNGHPVYQDQGLAAPWIGLRSSAGGDPVFRKLRLAGTAKIPREVSMCSGDNLRGWVLGPGAAQPDATQLSATPTQQISPTSAAPPRGVGDWSLTAGTMRHPRQVGASESARHHCLYYQRPLLDGESIQYEFQYVPDEVEVHPVLGRIVFLIEPDGVSLRWLTDPAWEWTGLPPDNRALDPLQRRGPKPLPLTAGAWHRVTLSLAQRELTILLDGQPIYVRGLDPADDTSFGLYHDQGRSEARVREAVLRGDWPEELSASQLDDLTGTTRTDLDEPTRRALGAIFDDRQITGTVLEVLAHAAELPALEQFRYLSEWVLPGVDHATLRWEFDFTPTHPAPPVSMSRLPEAGQKRQQIGGELVSPASALVRLAGQLGRLAELRTQVEQAPADTRLAQRARAGLLILIDIARQDWTAANQQFNILEELLQAAEFSTATPEWPETLALWQAREHPELREAARDVINHVLQQLRSGSVTGPVAWQHFLPGLAADLNRLEPPPDHAPASRFWSPVSRSTAWSRGSGLPPADWQVRPGHAEHRWGHAADYLYFHVPVRGDFEIEADVGGFGWHDTQWLVAGTWVAPLVSHDQYAVGSLREERPATKLNPPLSPTDAWIRNRTVVRRGVLELEAPATGRRGGLELEAPATESLATTYLNGRAVHSEVLPAEHDPWIAIRNSPFALGGARDVRITGHVEIPESVRLSAQPDLTGWFSYFDETVGGADGAWRHQADEPGGEIVGRRRGELRGSGLESLLQYHRPLLEDGSIEYEFYYEEGATHVHPALDRRAMLLDPQGVRIHWVTDGPYDRTELDPFNAHDEPAHRRGPQSLPLKSQAWNHLRLDLQGDTLRLTLNGELVYEAEVEPTNQRTFGLFRYADQVASRVRNIVWRGAWPRSLPPVVQQELAGDGADFLDERLNELQAVFEHDFVRDGFPLYRFHVYDAGWEEHITAGPAGLHVHRPGTRGDVRFVVSPRLILHGDFDITAEFEQLQVTPTADGKWGISLRSVLVDKDTTLCSIFRGLRRIPGNRDQQLAIGEYTQWAPDGTARNWYPGKTAEECTSGRLRLARRGELVYSFIAEGDSPHFRHIHTEKVGASSGRYDGVRLQTGAYSVVDEPGSASVVWKRLVVRAETITNLPVPPEDVKGSGDE